LVGIHGDDGKQWHKGIVAFIVLLIIAVGLFLGSTGYGNIGVFLDPAMASLIFWLVVIIAAAFLITKENKGNGGTAPADK